MHGELPQELSVTAAEVLGTGTGHAGGGKVHINMASDWTLKKWLQDCCFEAYTF